MAELYKQFGSEWNGLDWSDQALIDMFNSESFGTPVDERKNGYYIGKQWLGVTTNGWKDDLEKGYLFLYELYEDPRLPDWYLDQIFGSYVDTRKKRPTLAEMMKDIFGEVDETAR